MEKLEVWEKASIVLLTAAGVVLLGLQFSWGWGLWAVGVSTSGGGGLALVSC